MNKQELAEVLNERYISPTIKELKIVGLEENNQRLSNVEIKEIGLNPDDLGKISPHPGDSTQFVPTLSNDLIWDENEGWMG